MQLSSSTYCMNYGSDEGQTQPISSPVGRLPPELLCGCFRQSSNLDLQDIVSASHVSQYWRAVTLSEPRLWAVLRLVKRPCEVLCVDPELIARSASVPLSVSLIVDVGDMCWHNDDCYSLTESVRPFWHRVHDVEVTFNGYHDESLERYQARFSFLELPAPLLKSLYIIDEVELDKSLEHTENFLGGETALSHLEMERCAVIFPPLCPALHGLHTLSCRIQAQSSVSERLATLCPNIDHLKLFHNEKADPLPFHGPPLASLQHLTFYGTSGESAYHLSTIFERTNVDFLQHGRTITRLDIDNALVYKGQFHTQYETGTLSLEDDETGRCLIVSDSVGFDSERMSMQDLLRAIPSYHHIRELRIGYYILLHFLEFNGVLDALEHITIFIPNRSRAVEWRNMHRGPRDLLVLLDHRRREASRGTGRRAFGPGDLHIRGSRPSWRTWREHYDWPRIAAVLPLLEEVSIIARQSEMEGLGPTPDDGPTTFIHVADLSVLVRYGLAAAFRPLKRLHVYGINIVEREDQLGTVHAIRSLAEDVTLQNVVFGVGVESLSSLAMTAPVRDDPGCLWYNFPDELRLNAIVTPRADGSEMVRRAVNAVFARRDGPPASTEKQRIVGPPPTEQNDRLTSTADLYGRPDVWVWEILSRTGPLTGFRVMIESLPTRFTKKDQTRLRHGRREENGCRTSPLLHFCPVSWDDGLYTCTRTGSNEAKYAVTATAGGGETGIQSSKVRTRHHVERAQNSGYEELVEQKSCPQSARRTQRGVPSGLSCGCGANAQWDTGGCEDNGSVDARDTVSWLKCIVLGGCGMRETGRKRGD
ncbi:hypothetical protein BKA62DRAFT_671529 [Auriculariales sp. MPI-PUGE-AT-0066]|nr:hypothetical protein BKA62DRAFT_671529 [Auriculariales sp. MPI-PUGE-AT-0066]